MGKKKSQARLGKEAIAKGWLTRDQLRECLQVQKDCRRQGSLVSLGAILREWEYLTEEQVQYLFGEIEKVPVGLLLKWEKEKKERKEKPVVVQVAAPAAPHHRSERRRVEVEKRVRRRVLLRIALVILAVVVVAAAGALAALHASRELREERVRKNQQDTRRQLRRLASAQETFSFENESLFATVAALRRGYFDLDSDPQSHKVQADPDGDGNPSEYLREVWVQWGYRFEHFLAEESIEFYCVAEPVEYGSDGRQSYYTSHEKLLRREEGRRAGANSPPVR